MAKYLIEISTSLGLGLALLLRPEWAKVIAYFHLGYAGLIILCFVIIGAAEVNKDDS